jgi:serine/threonine-protein kinase
MQDLLTDLQRHFGDQLVMQRELGGGGMSRVVLAKDVQLDRRVVIKILPPVVTATISADRFRREIMLSAALQHPNVVPVLSSGEVDGLPYFIMPFIEGESLRARMMRGPLSVRETVNILRDVTRALVFAHGRGVIHRDIKPDNVLISSGAAVVTDFGVAKALSASRTDGARGPAPTITGVGMSPGTPAYMAPEQAAADPKTDHRADLYSLGILAYEMLAGTPPFHGRTPQALLAAQLSETPPPLASRRYDVPKILSELIARCLEKEPSRRPENAMAVMRTLEDPAVVSGVFDAPVPKAERSRRNAFAISLALLVVAFIGTWIWTSRLNEQRTDGNTAPLGTVSPVATEPAVELSIAVMPLDPVGPDARDAAAGITAELTNAIARLGGWRVVSQSSAMAIRDRLRQGTRAAGASPEVTWLLEGTVQRERRDLRVALRLVRLSNDSTEWAQSYDGVSDSTLVLQRNVAQAVTNAMLSAGAARATR